MGLTGVRFRLVDKDFFDLYKDEPINYVEKVQDFGKIDTSYGDFSFTFSIPATVKNLGLIDFYNDKSVVNSFNPFIEHPIEMWVNQSVFSRGQFKLIEITESNRTPKNIKIQYFSEVTNLKTSLQNEAGEDAKLSDLAMWDNYNHPISKEQALGYLSGGEVRNTNGILTPLKYPFASQDNIWHWQGAQYNGVRRVHLGAANYTGSDLDIGILNTEIRPAIPVSNVIGGIFELAALNNPLAGNYEITFAAKKYFSDLWVWIANGESWNNNIYDNRTSYGTLKPTYKITPGVKQAMPFTEALEDNIYSWNTLTQNFTSQVNGSYDVSMSASSGTSTIQFFYKTVIGGVTSAELGPFTPDGTVQNSHLLSVGDKIIDIVFLNPGTGFADLNLIVNWFLIESASQKTTVDVTIKNFVPDMLCTDFLLGILRTFNAVMYWDELQSKFIIDHKNNWYRAGNEINLTLSEDITKSTLAPPEFFKTYNMNFEEAEDFRSVQYAKSNIPNWGYANSATGYKYGQDYEVKNLFTATIWQEVVSIDSNGTPYDFSLGFPSFQAVDTEGESINPGVRLMYFDEGPETNGATQGQGTYTTADELGHDPTGSVIFNKFTALNVDYDFNFAYAPQFSWEVASVSQVAPVISDNLYTKFYRDYIGNVYNINTRRYNKSAFLNFQKVKEIKMNDTIIIDNRKYFINTLKYNSVTGRAEMDLIDWMPLEEIT